jgi:hypothetical protein
MLIHEIATEDVMMKLLSFDTYTLVFVPNITPISKNNFKINRKTKKMDWKPGSQAIKPLLFIGSNVLEKRVFASLSVIASVRLLIKQVAS